MMRRSGSERAWVLGLVAVSLAAACTRQNPAFLGPGDGGLPASDSGTGADGATAGDVGPAPDGGCDPGSPCTAAGNRCQIGTTSCGGDQPSCESLVPAPNGTSCALDQVCQDGSCIDCAAGARCDPGAVCRAGRLDCSFETGAIACLETGPAPDGTPCAAGVCYQGACNSATCGGLAGTACDPGQVCDLNGCGTDVVGVCVSKPATCTGSFAPVCGCDGTTYGNDCLRLQAAGAAALTHAGACLNATEDCMNGIDDNGDGLVDCDDPQCQAAYQCVPVAPDGWAEVGWVDPDGFPTCPPELPKVLTIYDAADLVAPPAGCGCACGAPSGAKCATHMTCYYNGFCDGMTSITYTVEPTCQAASLPNNSTACEADPPAAAGGSCTATPSVAKTPYSWSASGRGCMRDTAGKCADAGKRCIPGPVAGTAGPCISRRGDWTCPVAYPSRALVYDGAVADDRGCADSCSCSAVRGAACQCSAVPCGVAIHMSATCSSGGLGVVPADGATCKPISTTGGNTVGLFLAGASVSAAGACDPTTVSPIGGVVPTGPVTVCCAQ